jgi:hypothetical protein
MLPNAKLVEHLIDGRVREDPKLHLAYDQVLSSRHVSPHQGTTSTLLKTNLVQRSVTDRETRVGEVVSHV